MCGHDRQLSPSESRVIGWSPPVIPVDRHLAAQRRSRVGDVARESEDIALLSAVTRGLIPSRTAIRPGPSSSSRDAVEGLLGHWAVLRVFAGKNLACDAPCGCNDERTSRNHPAHGRYDHHRHGTGWPSWPPGAAPSREQTAMPSGCPGRRGRARRRGDYGDDTHGQRLNPQRDDRLQNVQLDRQL